MDISRLPEPLRGRAEELARKPALDTVREFLHGFVNDRGSLDEIHARLRSIGASTTLGLKRHARALDDLLAAPSPPGQLAELVALDADWRLDDPSDEGAAAFLRQLAGMLREVITEADEQRMRRHRRDDA